MQSRTYNEVHGTLIPQPTSNGESITTLEHAISTLANPNPDASVQNNTNLAFATSLLACTLGALLYLSVGQVQAMNAQSAGAYSGSALEVEAMPAVTVAVNASRTNTRYLDVRGSLPAGMVMGAASDREIVIEVRGSLDGRPSSPAIQNDRFSTQPDESKREVTVTGSRINESRVDDVPDHQTSRSAWLAHLRVLQDAIESLSTDDATRDNLIDQFEAEKAEFERVHPSTDLAAQLAVP